jgi:translocation and assembly module TamB
MTGYLGGGRVVANGGAVVEGLKLQRLRINLRGTDVTAPLPQGFVTTGDAEVEISSELRGNDYNTIIAGTIYGKRALYTKDIDLADFLGARREGTISEGTSTQPLLGIPQLDLRLEGRDALIVKNNIADMVASVSIRVTGDVDNPLLTGRITASRGTLFFRNDRYEIQQGSLEFPARYDESAIINLQAETEIQGYQVFASVAGSLSDLDALNVVLRSSPALPQSDVVSLVTTGSLSNTETGIPTLAQSGINTATKVLADTLINNPARRATDKLFGLNRFEIDPILSGRRLTPTARLTVGRQINKNLAITFSTNLSQERNQVLALEYRVSNKLSFVAQYEQNSAQNVTRKDNSFSFEIRLRRRF